MKKNSILMIGGAVADISLCPVDEGILHRHSTPVEKIPLSTGGDALNEASVLARLGDSVSLVTVLGEDAVGALILEECRQRGIDTRWIYRSKEIATSVNVVLVDAQGQRTFVTAKNSSLRRLGPEHVAPALDALDGFSCAMFASMFVSPCFGIQEMGALFRQLKERGLTLCADMTRRKNGETVEDLADVLPYVDVLFANQEEAALLTLTHDPEQSARRFLEAGVGHAIIKLGEQGCYAADCHQGEYIPAFSSCRVIDTTGAGDTFAAGFLHCLRQGLPVAECCRFANAAASLCVEQLGCAPEAVTLKKIESVLKL